MKEIRDTDVLYGTMTGHEKKMNKRDLHDFKHNKYDDMKAMIPGISNYQTIGAKPMARGQINVAEH